MDAAAIARLAGFLAGEYVSSLDERPAHPNPGAEAAPDPAPLPEVGIRPDLVLRALDSIAQPGLVATAGGRYFGFVTGGMLSAARGAGMLVSAWDQCASGQVSSPASAWLETQASHWVLELLGLPSDCGLGFVTGASMANFSALVAARRAAYSKLGYDVDAQGMAGAARLRVILPEEAHTTVLRALRLLGFGEASLEFVECDENGAMKFGALPRLGPTCIVCLQAGNVNSGAFDPFEEIITRARTADAWVHIDGAFGLWAAACESKRHLTNGYGLADSWSVDGHKWLNVGYDCGMVICKQADQLAQAMGLSAAYLGDRSGLDPSAFTPEFSRRARGIEVWGAIMQLGRSGLDDLIARTCRYARRFAEAMPTLGLEVLNRVELNQVVVSVPGSGLDSDKDELLETILHRVQEEGMVWFGPTRWKERPAFRFSVSSHQTRESDIDTAIECVRRAKLSANEPCR